MAIVRREEPLPATRRRLWDPFEIMRDLMQGELQPLTQWRGEGELTPAFDVKETKDAYVFKADLPGVKEEDLDVSLTGSRLTVSGKRQAEKREEDERFFAYEINYGSFSRSFTLPEGVDGEHVSAELKDGVLTLVMPKTPEVQPRRIALKGESKAQKAKA